MRQANLLASAIAILAAGLVLSGCVVGVVPVLASGPTELLFESVPDSAEVLVNGVSAGRTPLRLTLSPNREHTVTFRKEGCEELSFILATQVDGGWELVNLLDLDGTPVEFDGREFADKNPIGRLECEKHDEPT
jgi:hypothetical protein